MPLQPGTGGDLAGEVGIDVVPADFGDLTPPDRPVTTERLRDQLGSEADAEHRHSPVDRLAHERGLVATGSATCPQ